ncbi:MAG: sigma-54-dependent transcriptional regulator [Bdellovibrionales bacterium]
MSVKAEFTLLFVDDDPLIHQSLKIILPPHWRVISCQREDLVPYSQFVHLAIVDMHLDKNDPTPVGLNVIKKLHESQPRLEIFGASGDWSRELWEQALKKGAQKFIAKPWVPDEILSHLEKVEALWRIRTLQSSQARRQWVGDSTFSHSIRKSIAQQKGEWSPILIEGETGTGKEVIAQILNEQEATRPFVTVNVSAISDSLFESEMFGHIKGAFTGADQNRIGLIEAAHGGDLFLDEIEAFSEIHQAKLLRFLESGEIRPVGAKENRKVQTRVIVASNRSLLQMVKENKFREDLYFRMASTKIQLLPLRERSDDIPLLAQYFIENEKPRRNKKWEQDGLEALKKHNWPGNVRELKRLCEQLSLYSPLPIIRAEDVLQHLPRSVATLENITWDYTLGLEKMVQDFEAHAIQNFLKFEPDVEKAAMGLKVSKSNLYKKIKDYGLKTKADL